MEIEKITNWFLHMTKSVACKFGAKVRESLSPHTNERRLTRRRSADGKKENRNDTQDTSPMGMPNIPSVCGIPFLNPGGFPESVLCSTVSFLFSLKQAQDSFCYIPSKAT